MLSCVLVLIESNNVGIATDILCNYLHTFRYILYVAHDFIIDNRDLCHSASSRLCQFLFTNWQMVIDILPIGRIPLWHFASYCAFLPIASMSQTFLPIGKKSHMGTYGLLKLILFLYGKDKRWGWDWGRSSSFTPHPHTLVSPSSHPYTLTLTLTPSPLNFLKYIIWMNFDFQGSNKSKKHKRKEYIFKFSRKYFSKLIKNDFIVSLPFCQLAENHETRCQLQHTFANWQKFCGTLPIFWIGRKELAETRTGRKGFYR